MLVKKIELQNYRNISQLKHSFSSNLNIFVGKNGHGKTNLLESILMVTRGNTFRFGPIESLIKHDKEFASIKATLSNQNIENEIRLNIINKKKEILLNEKKVTAQKLQALTTVVLFSPESLIFIKDSGEHRRSLIDEFLISQNSNNFLIVNEFRKILKTKNKILKDYKEQLIDKITFENLYNTFNELFREKAVNLTLARLIAIKDIENDLNDLMQKISEENVEIAVEYLASNSCLNSLNKLEIAEKINKRMDEMILAEWASGQSLVGPHKHEINFLYNQKDSRIFCSQGQQRSIILSFKMSQIVYHRRVHGHYPILLLDDVLSELDLVRRKKLTGFLKEIDSQVFITSTEMDSMEGLNWDQVQLNYIENGQITRELKKGANESGK